jgi:circadian clock protein KaiC
VFRDAVQLAKRGVSALVTVGSNDNDPNLRFSNDIPFLTDAIVALRYAEVDGHGCASSCPW